MRTLAQSFTGQWQLSIYGQFFELIETAAPVDVIFYRNGSAIAQAFSVEQGYYSKPREPFDRVVITSASTQTVKVGISDGDGGYNRVSGSVQATIVRGSSFNELAPVSVGVAITPVAAANASRKALRIYNNGTAAVVLGGAGLTTANYVVNLLPGQIWVEDDAPAAAVYGIAAAAGQDVHVQEVI